MASPQIEDGYTRLANELLDAIIRHNFSSREYAIVMAVIRCTYGFNKKEDAISGWQLAEITGIDRSHVSKTLNLLFQKRVLLKSDRCRNSHGINVFFISLNKDYSEWLTVADSATVAKTAPVPKQPSTVAEMATVTVADLATRPLPKQPTHKDIPKDSKDIPKDSSAFAPPIPRDLLADWEVVRKAKRAGKVTQAAWQGLEREAAKAGITAAQAVRICCERGWTGFNAGWNWQASSFANSKQDGKQAVADFIYGRSGNAKNGKVIDVTPSRAIESGREDISADGNGFRQLVAE